MKLAYVEQSRESLDNEQAVWQAMGDGQEGFKLGSQWVNSRAYAARLASGSGRPGPGRSPGPGRRPPGESSADAVP